MESYSERTADDMLDEPDAGRPVRLCYARDPVEAGLICARLEAEGVPATTPGVTSWQMLWHMGPAVNPRGLEVMVRRSDLASARRVLADVELERRGFTEAPGPRLAEPLAEEEPAETAAQRDVRRGFRAAVIFCFLSILVFPLGIYSLVLLRRGRAAWDDPNPVIRRRCRRRIVVGALLDLFMLLVVVKVAFEIVT